MHSGHVKMWKRLLACFGVAAYLLLVMLAKSNFESTTFYNHPLLSSGADGQIKAASLLQRDEVLSLSEPAAFVSQNNSLQPVYHHHAAAAANNSALRKAHKELYESAVLVKRRYLSQNILANDHSKGNIYDPNSVESQNTELPPMASSRKAEPESGAINSDTRRRTRMCRSHTWAPECQARLVTCEPHLCGRLEEDDGGGGGGGRLPFLLVLIHSHPSHTYRRDAIRDTWGAIVRDYTLEKSVVFLYLLGSSSSALEKRAVAREVALYRDIVQYELIDSYNNLTVKSVLALDWIKTFCPNVTYVLKTDDDAFMNITNILDYLGPMPRRRILIGSMHAKSQVQRTGQWKVEKDIYSPSTYPPYCSGTAYVMSADMVNSLHRMHFSSDFRDKVLVPMEDVYLTGILPKRTGMVCKNSQPFPNWTTGPSPKSVEKLLKGKVFGIHGLSPPGMYGLNKLIKVCRKCAENAVILRKWFSLLTGAT